VKGRTPTPLSTPLTITTGAGDALGHFSYQGDFTLINCASPQVALPPRLEAANQNRTKNHVKMRKAIFAALS
jgi:hypothetical protein